MNESIFDEMFQDATENKEAPEVSEQSISLITRLAQEQLTVNDEIEAIDQAAKDKKKEFKEIQIKLAEAMDEAGMSSFETKDGHSVQIKDFVSASIKADNKDEAFAWLEQNGHSDLIKHEVKLAFRKGENEKADQALKILRDEGFTPDDKESVHSGTLSSFCREQIEAGNPIPLELLGVYQERKSIIK